MTKLSTSEAAKAVVRRNTEEVQGAGNFEVFEELFADDFLDHTPQPGRTPDKAGARELYKVLRAAFPDFHADIHWQLADGDVQRRVRFLMSSDPPSKQASIS
jgi:SnoaL-like polyketide cyclase